MWWGIKMIPHQNHQRRRLKRQGFKRGTSGRVARGLDEEIKYEVKMTSQLNPTKPPSKLDPGFSCPAPKATMEAQDKNARCQNDTRARQRIEIGYVVKMTTQPKPRKPPIQPP
jgi:hypothetical protein